MRVVYILYVSVHILLSLSRSFPSFWPKVIAETKYTHTQSEIYKFVFWLQREFVIILLILSIAVHLGVIRLTVSIIVSPLLHLNSWFICKHWINFSISFYLSRDRNSVKHYILFFHISSQNNLYLFLGELSNHIYIIKY